MFTLIRIVQVTIGNSVLVGTINFRQHRTLERDCDVAARYRKLLQRHVTHCRYDYERKYRATHAYGRNVTWLYFDDDYSGGTKVTGRHGSYGADGYLTILSRDRCVSALHVHQTRTVRELFKCVHHRTI